MPEKVRDVKFVYLVPLDGVWGFMGEVEIGEA